MFITFFGGIFTLLLHLWMDIRISPTNHAVKCQLFNLKHIRESQYPTELTWKMQK